MWIEFNLFLFIMTPWIYHRQIPQVFIYSFMVKGNTIMAGRDREWGWGGGVSESKMHLRHRTKRNMKVKCYNDEIETDERTDTET